MRTLEATIWEVVCSSGNQSRPAIRSHRQKGGPLGERLGDKSMTNEAAFSKVTKRIRSERSLFSQTAIRDWQQTSESGRPASRVTAQRAPKMNGAGSSCRCSDQLSDR